VRATDVAARFLEALSHRDFAALGATFAEDGRLRGLMPSGIRECEGRASTAERLRILNGDLDEFELLDSEVVEMADLMRTQWRVRGFDEEEGLSVYEQTAYVGIESDRIARMNLVCSGHRPLSA
jgi:SnoaL-like protein